MAKDDPATVRQWVEKHMGGNVVACERQPRWRPAYFLELEKNGERSALYFRGDRGVSESNRYALEHEMACLQVLEAGGIPVPHVFGFCEKPRGILMERSPGRANLATAVDSDEQRAVQRHYMELLARMHALDVQPFLAAGLPAPAKHERLALADLPIWEKAYRMAKARPEPLIEFALQWLKRNLPEPSGPASFVCGDSGQFLFDEGRVTAIIDLELAHLGDPAEDLGALRCRDLSEPLGDLRHAVADYQEFGGCPVDPFLLDFHTVRFALMTPLATLPILGQARPGVDLIQYLCWFHVYSRAPLEVIAHRAGVDLQPPALPTPEPNRHSPIFQDLSLRLKPSAVASSFDDYAQQTAYRTAVYLERLNRHGPALEADNIADVDALLGAAHANADEADAALEGFILAADPGADADLLRLLHRRCLREATLLEPVLAEFSGVQIQLFD